MAPRKSKTEDVVEAEGIVLTEPSEVLKTSFDFSKKANLLALYNILKDLNVRSISDLEGLIARAE
jgi:hypothetical protein